MAPNAIWKIDANGTRSYLPKLRKVLPRKHSKSKFLEAFQNRGENGEGDEEKTLHEIQMYIEEKYKYRLKRNTSVGWREIQLYVEDKYNNV